MSLQPYLVGFVGGQCRQQARNDLVDSAAPALEKDAESAARRLEMRTDNVGSGSKNGSS